MNSNYPVILSRRRTPVSAWLELIEKEVQFSPDRPPEIYHCITQRAYVSIFAQTEGGLIPIVRQYRPCVEEYTWEFPAGTIDDGETPEQAMRRELLEETGDSATSMVYLGNFHPDTGRVQVDSHAFYGRIVHPEHPVTEAGIFTSYVSHAELKQMIASGEFRHQLHVAIYGAILARGIEP
jgi:ADP-ribose pyrophosphatase YjhB (NUDIX family)